MSLHYELKYFCLHFILKDGFFKHLKTTKKGEKIHKVPSANISPQSHFPHVQVFCAL